jgi:TrmH family RNA methyltransferase
MGAVVISSLDNPHVKEVVHLRERNYRDKTSLFLIEGYRETLRAHDGKVAIQKLFICSELFLGENEPELIAKVKSQGAQIIPTTQKVFHKMSYRDRPDGLIAVAKQMRKGLKELDEWLKNIKNPLLVIAEAIEKPGNLGTILRSADAAGCDALIVCDKCTDIFNPNVVRASVGTLFTVAVFEATSEETLAYLQKKGIPMLAAMPQAKALYTEVDMKGAVSIAVGTEQLGLSEKMRKGANLQVRIPMLGTADSLNVAMATTLILFEAVRQRHEISRTL